MGQVERSVCSEERASCSVLESVSVLLGCKLQSENVLRSVCKLQYCMFATSGGFAQFDKLRENV